MRVQIPLEYFTRKKKQIQFLVIQHYFDREQFSLFAAMWEVFDKMFDILNKEFVRKNYEFSYRNSIQFLYDNVIILPLA